ncbi:hypothetical protein IM793_01350 [Pedobacter sp. MR2016-19]|uniref:hypothetical protein n=1 Tax=Pedobacter sp. MR2016-19 TaxID=2780089 RepID=UPI0018753364|nr:hypothetical protein [Pedobacter sp. MR2016-19]MBE5317787.1 hypothetical protein [Pedobacter sp. MR2016-19]
MINTTTHIHYKDKIPLHFEIKNLKGNKNEFLSMTTFLISENIEVIINKALNVLVPFTDQIFKDEYEKKQGYFELGEITVEDTGPHSYVSNHITYTLAFSLESHSGFVLDYLSYSVVFDTQFTLTAVSRG